LKERGRFRRVRVVGERDKQEISRMMMKGIDKMHVKTAKDKRKKAKGVARTASAYLQMDRCDGHDVPAG
jgi:hypothetical protein